MVRYPGRAAVFLSCKVHFPGHAAVFLSYMWGPPPSHSLQGRLGRRYGALSGAAAVFLTEVFRPGREAMLLNCRRVIWLVIVS